MTDDVTAPTAPAERALDIRITAGVDVGFVVWEAGEVLAALTSRVELAEWIETRLGLVAGEQEREAAERAEYDQTMPRIIRPDPKRTRWHDRWRRRG